MSAAKPGSKKLTLKQETFCKAYVECGKAAQAYRKAYDTKMPAKAVASSAKKLMRMTPIRLRIEELAAERTSPEHGLTLKQENFARFYLETGNASEAYRRAYDVAPTTKPEAVHVNASKLLADAKVALRIAELSAAAQRRHEVTIERLKEEYARMGYANMEDYVRRNVDGTAQLDLTKVTRAQMAAVQEMTFETVLSADPKALEAAGLDPDDEDAPKRVAVIKTKFKLHDKKGPLDSLGKHLGMFQKDNEQAGKAAGEALGEAIASSPRDLARAVLDILREAKVEQAPPAQKVEA